MNTTEKTTKNSHTSDSENALKYGNAKIPEATSIDLNQHCRRSQKKLLVPYDVNQSIQTTVAYLSIPNYLVDFTSKSKSSSQELLRMWKGVV